MLPSESNHITGPEQRRIMTTAASDIGIFSGKEKKRLELSNDELDPTHKFAIALFDDKDVSSPENTTWVYVKGPGNEKVKADVSSIAKRLNLAGLKGGKAEVIQLAERGELDDKIQALIDAYERDISVVKELLRDIKKLNSNIDEFDENKGKIKNLLINTKLGTPNSVISKLLFRFTSDNYNDLEFKGKDLLHFNDELEKFESKLAKLDQNLASNVEIPREKVTENTILWAKPRENAPHNLLADCTAEKVEDQSDSKGESAVRLNLHQGGNDGNRFAIKTDGYIYHQEPKASDKFVPYTKDGKSWILLNVDSLHYRTGISKEKIKEAVNSLAEMGLNKLISSEELYQQMENYQSPSQYRNDHIEIDEQNELNRYAESEDQKQQLNDAIQSFNMDASRFSNAKLFGCKDFNSFLERFKKLNQEDLLKELTSGPLTLKKNASLVKMLIEERGDEAVRFAAKQGEWKAFNKLVHDLVEFKKDLNTTDENGNTLLHLALINTKDKSVGIIGSRIGMDKMNTLRKKLDFIPIRMDIPNKAGKTANDLIKESEYAEKWWLI